MSFLSVIKYLYFKKFSRLLWQNSQHSINCQQKVFEELVQKAKETAFGKEHHFERIYSYESFCDNVPLKNYEDFLPYTGKIFKKEKDLLWPGLPQYFGKTSGTSSGNAKYIPVTKEFIRSTQFAAKYMLANLALQSGHSILEGKVFYISDPHVFENKNGFLCAAISAIKSRNIPRWVKHFALPGDAVNSISDAAERLEKTIEEIKDADIRTAVALPVWLIKFLDEYEKTSGEKFKEHFKKFKVLFSTGMNYEPYEKILRKHLGENVLILENYTATEGNFAFQDRLHEKGMQLICNQGIFYEFIPFKTNSMKPGRLRLQDVEIHTKYIMAVSTNSGLWAYRMNDIVEFVSINPYRLIVCGRVNDVFSPFGEHMLAIEAEQAIGIACEQTGNIIKNFIVTPAIDHIMTPHHTWYVEFISDFKYPEKFSHILNDTIRKNNVNYNDLIHSKTIGAPVVEPVRKGFFEGLMRIRKQNSAQTKQNHFETDPGRIKEIEQQEKYAYSR